MLGRLSRGERTNGLLIYTTESRRVPKFLRTPKVEWAKKIFQWNDPGRKNRERRRKRLSWNEGIGDVMATRI